MDEFGAVFIQYQDHLAPTLDVYEQAIYMFLLRQTVLEGRRETVVGFKSARKRLGYGIGKAGAPPSEGVLYAKLRSLEVKGCIQLNGSERAGTRVTLKLSSEIKGLIPTPSEPDGIDLEDLDFFGVLENRAQILEREEWQCFYCRARLDESNHVLEHVVSRPEGDNSYRNIVAACRRCNNRKGSTAATEHLRVLYREGIISGDDITQAVARIEALQSGKLKPRAPIDA
jgi:HNH endonuclease